MARTPNLSKSARSGIGSRSQLKVMCSFRTSFSISGRVHPRSGRSDAFASQTSLACKASRGSKEKARSGRRSHAPRSEHGGDPFEGERLEEVGQVVQGVPGVDEVGWLAPVLVGEKSVPRALDVLNAQPFGPLPEESQHRRGHVNRYQPPAKRGDGQSERTRAGPEVDQGVGLLRAKAQNRVASSVGSVPALRS